MLPPFERIPVSNAELQRVQDRLLVTLVPMSRVAVLDGVLLKGLSLTTSFQNVNHGLGRAPAGWIVVGKNANADVWENPLIRTGLVLVLRSSAAVNVDLWVF